MALFMSYFLSFPKLMTDNSNTFLSPDKPLETICLSISTVCISTHVIMLSGLYMRVIASQLIALLFIYTIWLKKIFLKYKLGCVDQFVFLWLHGSLKWSIKPSLFSEVLKSSMTWHRRHLSFFLCFSPVEPLVVLQIKVTFFSGVCAFSV